MSKIVLILCVIFFCSCGNKAQNQDKINQFQKMKVLSAKDIFIDDISEIKGVKQTDPIFIQQRLEQMFGKFTDTLIKESGLKKRPDFILYRVFKEEAEFEVWGGNSTKDSLSLIGIFQICAMDKQSGPKLKQGDQKTPEGIYSCRFLYGSTFDFMWIHLQPDKIDDFGNAGKGSSFRLCIDYPNSVDLANTKSAYKINTDAGGAICIHGNCVSAGCISFENKVFCLIFRLSLLHNEELYGQIQLQIYPFRFKEKNLEVAIQNSHSDLPKNQLKLFWENLEKGYLLFEDQNRKLNKRIIKSRYVFEN